MPYDGGGIGQFFVVIGEVFEDLAKLAFIAFLLLITCVVMVLAFRYAFGIDLLNAIDLLPSEWREKLPVPHSK
jgi:hypothetical protein